MTVKLLKRTATFDPILLSTGKLEEEDIPIQIGKKGRVWQEGVERGKAGGREILERFEGEVGRLKVLVAREYVKGVVAGRVKGGEGEEVKVECDVSIVDGISLFRKGVWWSINELKIRSMVM